MAPRQPADGRADRGLKLVAPTSSPATAPTQRDPGAVRLRCRAGGRLASSHTLRVARTPGTAPPHCSAVSSSFNGPAQSGGARRHASLGAPHPIEGPRTSAPHRAVGCARERSDPHPRIGLGAARWRVPVEHEVRRHHVVASPDDATGTRGQGMRHVDLGDAGGHEHQARGQRWRRPGTRPRRRRRSRRATTAPPASARGPRRSPPAHPRSPRAPRRGRPRSHRPRES